MRWCRLHADTVNDPKIRLLAFEDRWHFIALLCLKADGLLDQDISPDLLDRQVAVLLGLTVADAVKARQRLEDVGLVGEDWQPRGWGKRQYQSDVSTDRVREHRRKRQEAATKQGCNVSETPPDTDTDTEAEEKTTTAASRPSDDDQFEAFKAAYPKRAGSQPWPRARKAINARLREGHTWQEIMDGVARYAAFCKATGKIGTETVAQAATFCGPDKRFLEPFEIPHGKPGVAASFEGKDYQGTSDEDLPEWARRE